MEEIMWLRGSYGELHLVMLKLTIYNLMGLFIILTIYNVVGLFRGKL